MVGGEGPLFFASGEGDSSCWGAGRGSTCPGGLSGSGESCLGLVTFFMAGGVSGGVSGTKTDIGGGGGGGDGSPSGEGLGSGGILAPIAARVTQDRKRVSVYQGCLFIQLLHSFRHVCSLYVLGLFPYILTRQEWKSRCYPCLCGPHPPAGQTGKALGSYSRARTVSGVGGRTAWWGWSIYISGLPEGESQLSKELKDELLYWVK